MTRQYRVVMVRHGESEWNLQNLFCGWYDAKLSDIGEYEAQDCRTSVLSLPPFLGGACKVDPSPVNTPSRLVLPPSRGC